MEWPSPDQPARRRRRRLVILYLVLAGVMLVAATALVHGFDVVARNAAMAQLIAEGGPVFQDACACDPAFRLPLPDWRSLAVWGLAMVAAAASAWLNSRCTVGQNPPVVLRFLPWL